MKRIIYLLFFCCTLTSCQDWFDAPPKDSKIPEEELFNNESAFRNMLNGIYAELNVPELYGANLTLGGIEFLGQSLIPDEELRKWAEYDYSDSFSKQLRDNVWEKMYHAIYSCNNLLRLFDSKNDVVFVEGAKETMRAEVIALRAFLHYELIRLFHPAYQVDKDYTGVAWMSGINAQPQFLSTEMLLEKILLELTESEKILQEYDPVSTGVSLNNSYLLGMAPLDRAMKMNYYAVLGVKARVAMEFGTEEKNDIVLEACDIVISTGKYPFLAVISTDLAFSSEYIFFLSSTNKNFSTLSQHLFVERNISVAPHIDLSAVKTESPDEKRLRWYTPDLTNLAPKYGPASIMKSWKVEQGIPMLKIGEIYLMAAEAALKSNPDKTVGFRYLKDFLDKRFFNSNVLSSSSEEDMLNEIKRQYQYEFMGEGRLFFYYKRNNEKSIYKYDGSTLQMDANHYMLPIPKN